MKKILVIENSPNQNSEKGSLSQKITNKLLSSISFQHEVKRHNLDKEPYFQECINATNMGKYFDAKSDELIKELVESDVIIFSTPTENFGVPSILKNYMDRVLQASKTFKYKYDHGVGGSVGLLPEGKKCIIINTQGSPNEWYPFTSTISQIEGSMKFIGIKNTKSILVDGTKTPEISPLSYEEIVKKYDSKIAELVDFIK